MQQLSHHIMTMNAASSQGQSTVAVVLATNKKGDSLDRCVHSFLSVLEYPEDLIFVDNGSDDHLSVEMSGKFRGLTTVRLEANRFFCGGYNAGIKRALERGYDYVLISNADTEVVKPEFIGELLRVAKRWPRAAFIGPLVYFRDRDVVQKTCLQFPGVVRGAAIWFPWRFARGYVDRQSKKERAVEFLNGVCVLCRIESLKEIGLMDENMGGYVEDADWAWRARRMGWLSVFSPVPSVIHHENPNGYEPHSLKSFLLKRNTVYWYLKNGMRYSAISYAKASILLEKARLLSSKTTAERKMHEYFSQKLIRSYKGLLRYEPLGEWFGPPIGQWEMSAED